MRSSISVVQHVIFFFKQKIYNIRKVESLQFGMATVARSLSVKWRETIATLNEHPYNAIPANARFGRCTGFAHRCARN